MVIYYFKKYPRFEERRTLMAKKIKGSQKSDSAKFADLFVHIGDAEIKGNLPVEGIFNTQLYREVSDLLSKISGKFRFLFLPSHVPYSS